MDENNNPQVRNAYGLREIAKRNGISLGTVYNEIRAGRLRPFKIGTRTLIRDAEEQAWLQRLQEQAA